MIIRETNTKNPQNNEFNYLFSLLFAARKVADKRQKTSHQHFLADLLTTAAAVSYFQYRNTYTSSSDLYLQIMGRDQFEYDETGSAFNYVLISFYCVALVPLTHFLWPSTSLSAGFNKLLFICLFLAHTKNVDKGCCRCDGCVKKQSKKDAKKPRHLKLRLLKAIILIAAWAALISLGHKVSQIEPTHAKYDPYKILGLNQVF